MPIMHQTEINAILYMENNMISNCFKEEQTSVLNILAIQISISLQNAKHFKSQVEHTKELTKAKASRDQEALYRRKQEEFVDRICHEIRNPIQGLIGSCDMIQESLDTLSPYLNYDVVKKHVDTTKASLESIQVCGRYQKVITDDVLTLSKLELNRMNLSLEPMNVIYLIENTIKMFEIDALRKGIYVKYKSNDLGDFTILGDFNRISQVLINLVSNAIKFTIVGGVTISLSCEHKSDNKVELLFGVEDSGIGIKEDHHVSIFERFVQVPSAQNKLDNYSGSGLGLFISKMLVNLMGGQIWIQNASDHIGSCFYFTIQCALSDIPPPALQQPFVDDERVEFIDRKLKVLLVEDNAINQKVIMRAVCSCNCECDVAGDGIQGLQMYKSNHNYDFVLMDVSMPNMNGLECTAEIRKYEEEKEIKRVLIVGLSANARVEHQEEAFASGMDQYMVKPVPRNTIHSIVTAYRSNNIRRKSK
ncbi:hybrid signal transduction histidine kinase dhkK [Acrasis kona]|uniref:Hybrid signal transduction histidine kinase dhkK n=1 Tax=Acrasis kona TaxID=1008807 RepID=A0AAW2YV35_9EUKA